jgi:hypothetical protein
MPMSPKRKRKNDQEIAQRLQDQRRRFVRRTAAGGGAGGDSEAGGILFQAPAFDDTSNGWGGWNIRQLCIVGDDTYGQVQVKLQASALQGLNCNRVYIGKWAVGTEADTTGPHRRVTFNGGYEGFYIPAGATIVSDWANLGGFAAGDKLVVCIDVPYTPVENYGFAYVVSPGNSHWYRQGQDAATQVVGAHGANGAIIADAVIAVVSIEGGSGHTVPTAIVYTGLGEALTAAGADSGNLAAWWGVRAASTYQLYQPGIRLRRSSDNTESDFRFVGNGDLDIAAITTFKGASNLFVVKWYDQAENGLDILQATAAKQPAFNLANVNGHPAVDFGVGRSLAMAPLGFTINQPFTFVGMTIYTGPPAYGSWEGANAAQLVGHTSTANQIRVHAGADLVAAATDNVWHSVIAVTNGVSSNLAVDGVSTIGNAGTSIMSASAIIFIGTDTYNSDYYGRIAEGGLWFSGLVTLDIRTITQNQSSYFGTAAPP